MLRCLRSPGRTVAGAAALLACSIAIPPAPAAQPAPRARALTPDDAWDTLVADVLVTSRRVTRQGTPTGATAPPVRYRVERSRVAGRWRTTMTLADVPGPQILSTNGTINADTRSAIARIEDDEDGTGPRFVDRSGQVVAAPTDAELARIARGGRPVRPDRTGRPATRRRDAGDAGWIRQLLPAARDKGVRRAALERTHGAPVGRVRGLDRFVSTEGDGAREVLADPVSALPVEVNVTRGGRLLSHREIRYEPGPGGAPRQRSVRVERLISPASGERTITEIDYTTLRLERRR